MVDPALVCGTVLGEAKPAVAASSLAVFQVSYVLWSMVKLTSREVTEVQTFFDCSAKL